MSELDQISRLLGNIEAHQATTNAEIKTISAKIELVRKEHTEVLTSLQEYTNRLESLENELAKEITPTIKEVNKLKQRGIGLLTAIGFISAGASVGIMKALKYFFHA